MNEAKVLTKEEIGQELVRRRDQEYLKDVFVSQIASFLGLQVFFLILTSYDGVTNATTWWLVSSALIIARFLHTFSLRRSDEALSSKQNLAVNISAFIVGMAWGAAPIVIQTSSDLFVFDLIVLFLAGVTAAAAMSTSARIITCILFICPIILGIFLTYTARQDVSVVTAGLGVAIYLLVLMQVASRANALLRRALSNQIEAEQKKLELDENERRLVKEMEQRLEQEKTVKENLARNRMFGRELEAISTVVATEKILNQDDLFDRVLPRMSAALNVGRVSVWLYTPERDAIVCHGLFDHKLGALKDELRLEVSNFPEYFEAIENNLLLNAPDVRNDPRTSKFTEPYLKPLDIHSLLDAPIRSGAEVIGVVCCEAVGQKHFWTYDEQAFVSSVAQFIAMTMMAEGQAELAKQKHTALEEAQQASATKSSFLANMSHEIRTPMNGVLGAAKALRQSGLDEKQEALAKVISESGDSLMNVLNDILDFSKIEAGHLSVESAEFSVRDVMEKISSIHGLKAREKEITLDIRVADEVSDERLGDEYRLGQVLHNLVSNAIKFTNEGGVRVLMQASDQRDNKNDILITVSDTGVGMSQEEAKRAFEQFTQADASTTRNYGGTGLGLSIVQGLVEAMGGQLSCETKKGIGTEFEVLINLPVLSMVEAKEVLSSDEVAPPVAEGAYEEGPIDRPSSSDLPPLRVLLVEDNETNRMVAQALLMPLSPEVVMAENGQVGVELFEAQEFDIVLMDIQMPVMDGEQALVKMREYERQMGRTPTPILAVTANAMTHHVKRYRELGFSGHVAKPIRQDSLMEEIATHKQAAEAAEAVSQRA